MAESMSNTFGLLGRVRRALKEFGRQPVDFQRVEKQLDAMIQDKQLATGPVEKESQLEVRRTVTDLGYSFTYNFLREWVVRSRYLEKKWYTKPLPNTPDRDFILDMMWKEEPILAGAVYSMVSKMTSLKWSLSGKKRMATNYAKVLARAAFMGGWDWGGFLASSAQDFYTLNRGTFWEVARDGDPAFSPMTDIGHIDALSCVLTGNQRAPVAYTSEMTGQHLRFAPGEFIHFVSLPSAREFFLGSGFCAVDRSFRAAKLLMGLHDYDDEKLDNLPPEGIAAVTGLTTQELYDAFLMWKSKREQDNSLTYPQVLWLCAQNPSAAGVKIDFSAFSQLPESFDRASVIEQYVNTVALSFGVEAGEFWTWTGGGARATGSGAAEIQHMKSRGKGPADFISTVERHLNGELPEDCDFKFDTQDIEEDANAAAVAKAWIDAFFVLYNLPPKGETQPQTQPVQKAQGNPNPDKPNGEPNNPTPMIAGVKTGNPMSSNQQAGQGSNYKAEQVITKDQLLRLLADREVIPDWMVNDERVLVNDTDVHNRYYGPYVDVGKEHNDDNDPVCFEWERGVLKQRRVKGMPIIIGKPKEEVVVPEADLYNPTKEEKSMELAWNFLMQQKEKALDKRKIRGNPIPTMEATRGSMPTRKTIHDELELWRKTPELAPYAPTLDEEEKIFGKMA